ncbi:MAG: co-chaperone DjlA [Woeseiaceae bacterium]
MNYLGKVIGGVAGLASGKWALVIFGVVLGHQFDRGYAKYASGRLPKSFVRVAFSLMGHLAKADGRVSEDEIRLARKAMHAMDLDGDATQAAMRHFNVGKQPGYAPAEDLALLRKESGSPHLIGRQLINLLLPVLLMKDEASANERRILWQACQEFGISRVELAQIEAAARVDRRFTGREGPRPADPQSGATKAFALLNVNPDASDAEIKRAYRKLMNRFHPDKLAGTVTDPVELEAASKKTREVREAYELLRDRRGFK